MIEDRKVYLVRDDNEGDDLGIFTSKNSAIRKILEQALEDKKCDLSNISSRKSEYNQDTTYYTIDYLEFSIIEMILED